MKFRDVVAPLLLLLASTVVAPANPADNYPSRPVKFIVPWSPSGGTDIIARVLSEKLRKSMGQPFLVENRPGAAGNIGASYVAKQPPDGYTIMLATITLATNPAFYKHLDFDATKSFAPITLVAAVPHLLVVRPSLPVHNVKELIELAKREPGKLNYSSAGLGSPFYIAAELFKQMAHVNIVHIPYKGGGPAITDLLGGQVDMSFANLVAVLPFVKSGKLRALAVTTAKRSSAAPDIPTMAEAGLPGYDFSSWFGILAPAGTPHAIIEKLNKEIVKALKSPEVTQRLSEQGADLIASTPEAFGTYLKAETAKWAKLTKAARIPKN